MNDNIFGYASQSYMYLLNNSFSTARVSICKLHFLINEYIINISDFEAYRCCNNDAAITIVRLLLLVGLIRI